MFKPAAIGLCLATLVFSHASCADEPVVIKFSHVVTEDTPKGQGALLFKKLVEERLAGKVKVEVYPNSTLYGENDEIQALQNNQVQILAPALSNFSAYTKRLEVFDLPFLFDDLEAVERFQRRRASQELLSSMAGHGITGLAFWNNGMKQLSATQPLKRPSDAQGLTFRIQPSGVLEEQFGVIGAKALKVPFSQSYQVMKTGQAQGGENPWSNLYGQKLHTVQPYITESNHGVLSYMLITNTQFWNALPFALRNDLQGILDEVTQVVNAQAEAINAKERELIVAAGTSQVIALNETERNAWRQAMQPLYKTYEQEIGADVIRAAQIVNRR